MQWDYFIRTANTDHRISEFNRIACIIPLLDRAKKEAILMKIKKELCIIMAAISLLSFAACSGTAASEPDGENKDRGNGTESASQTSAESRTESSPSDKDPQQKIWEIICDGIMQWINTSAMNPAPSAATHPTAGSAGMANITKITLT